MIQASLRMDTKRMQQRLGELTAFGGPALRNAMQANLFLLVGAVTKRRMVKAGPKYINRRTGTGIRSVVASPKVKVIKRGDALAIIRGTYGSDRGYIKDLEQGKKGTEKVPAVQVRRHRRRLPSGKRVKVRSHPRAAHTRRVNRRARHFFRDTTEANRRTIAKNAGTAMRLLNRKGKVPSVNSFKLRGGK